MKITLYCSKFQALILRLDNKSKEEIDNIIKDYIGKVRRKRDTMYRMNILPINALVETSTYKP